MNIIHSKGLFDGGEGMEEQNDQKNLLTVSKGDTVHLIRPKMMLCMDMP